MKKCRSLIAICTLACGIAADALSGEMMPAYLYLLDEARVIPAETETGYAILKVRASDPVTKESYEGTTSWVSLSDSSNGVLYKQEAIFVGNRGNLIECSGTGQKGNPPHGFLSCKDKSGKSYRMHY